MNTIGQLFSVTSFGESHGSHVGCVIDGCPAGLLLDQDQIQKQVNRRKANQSVFATARKEEDIIDIISGVFENKTTGTPICILIKNKDLKSEDYDQLKDIYRPNHADYTYAAKYGTRDHRGGGRSSVRITAPLVAAGDIPMVLTIYQHITQASKDKGMSIDWFALKPTIARTNGIGIARHAPHPNAALLFYDYMLSETGAQKAFSALGYVPTNAKLPSDLPKDLRIVQVDPALVLDQVDKWSKSFEEVFIKHTGR